MKVNAYKILEQTIADIFTYYPTFLISQDDCIHLFYIIGLEISINEARPLRMLPTVIGVKLQLWPLPFSVCIVDETK